MKLSNEVKGYLNKQAKITTLNGRKLETPIQGKIFDVLTENGKAAVIWIETENDIYESENFEIIENNKLEKSIKKEYCSTVLKESNPDWDVKEERAREFLIHFQNDHDKKMIEDFLGKYFDTFALYDDYSDKYIGYITVCDEEFDTVSEFKSYFEGIYSQMKKELK